MIEAKDTENHTQAHFSNSPDTIDLPPEPGPTNQSAGSESKNIDKDTAGRAEMLDAEPETENGAGTVQYEENRAEEVPQSLSNQEATGLVGNTGSSSRSFPWDPQSIEGDDSGTEEEQAAFMKELESFFRGRGMDFKPPKFYGEGLNCLKLWRAVIRLGGYDTVTSCKLWRQVGESFNPPRTCTTVSWSFRCFYEKALLDYERHKVRGGELHVHVASPVEPMGAENQVGRSQALGPVRVRRDAAARAMQGWHSQRLLSNGYVGDSPIKDKSPVYVPKREKQLKSLGVLKRKEPSSMEHGYEAACVIGVNPHVDAMVVDVGPSADWVKINVRRTKDCFEIYALVPGLLREEVINANKLLWGFSSAYALNSALCMTCSTNYAGIVLHLKPGTYYLTAEKKKKRKKCIRLYSHGSGALSSNWISSIYHTTLQEFDVISLTWSHVNIVGKCMFLKLTSFSS